MQRSELVTLIGDLTNDPSHDRYTSSQIYVELDITQRKWNVTAKLLKDTVSISVVAGTRQYALSNLTGTPISFERVTLDGIDLEKVDKTYIDLYTSRDWTQDTGTPVRYFIETTDPDVQYITLHPTPTEADTLVCEYVKDHTTMASDSSLPFNDSPLLVPYHFGLAYDVSARMLVRDPNPENVAKIPAYAKTADNVLDQVVQTFLALERQEPYRIRGGRTWKY